MADEFIALVARLDHSEDEGAPPVDPDGALDALDGLIRMARGIMAKTEQPS